MFTTDNDGLEQQAMRQTERGSKAEDGGLSGRRDRVSETVPFDESEHPSLRAERELEQQPRTRQYGHSATGRRNDRVAYTELKQVRRLLGMRPMAGEVAELILDGEPSYYASEAELKRGDIHG